MPRVTLPATQLLGPYDVTIPPAITWTAADAVEGNQFSSNGKRVLLARNVGASTHTVTITARGFPPANWEENSGPHNLAASEMRVFPMFPVKGWQQSDGMVYVNANHAEVEFAVLDVPNA